VTAFQLEVVTPEASELDQGPSRCHGLPGTSGSFTPALAKSFPITASITAAMTQRAMWPRTRSSVLTSADGR
jgi:hypothetical protein